MRKIIFVSTLGARNQIIVPKEVRDKLDVKSSDKLVWIEEDGKFHIEKRDE